MTQSNTSKFALFGIGIAVAFLGGIFFSGMDGRNLTSARNEIETAVKAGRDAPIFAVIESKFASDYAEFFDNAAALSVDGFFDGPVGEKRTSDFRQAFLTQLRQKYASFLRVAAPDAARAIQESTLAILKTMADQPGLCARYAAYGGNGISIGEAEAMDITPIINVSVLVYKMIAEGRDHPVENPVALPEDKQAFFDLWVVQTRPTADMKIAIFTNDWQHPDYCAATISLQEVLVTDRSAATIRLLIDRTATGMAL